MLRTRIQNGNRVSIGGKGMKEERKMRMTPLLLIAAFLSLTEIIAGVTVLKTAGIIQIILTVFVVTFPVFISIAFFYLLAFRNYVLFAPHEYAEDTSVSEYVQAMSRQQSVPEKYDLTAHALLGVLDAIKQELPEVISNMPQPPKKTVTIQADVSTYKNRFERKSMGTSDFVKRVTAGSISREDAAKKFRFLLDDHTRITTQKAIGMLSGSDSNFFFRIRLDGNIHSMIDLNNFHHNNRVTTGDRPRLISLFLN